MIKNAYSIDPALTKVNRLSVLSFENENNRTSFSNYFVPNVWINDFNALISGKGFWHANKKWQRNIQASYWNGKKHWLHAGNSLDYEYFSIYYKLIAIEANKMA